MPDYLKPVLVGIAAALLAPVLWILGKLVVPVTAVWLESENMGAGAIHLSVGSGELFIAAIVGFVGGFAWQRRRAGRVRRGTSGEPPS
jgi:hypothetical protein